jgi:hypothetical protein
MERNQWETLKKVISKGIEPRYVLSQNRASIFVEAGLKSNLRGGGPEEFYFYFCYFQSNQTSGLILDDAMSVGISYLFEWN